MSTPDARWFWADAALEWLDSLDESGDPAAVAGTLELANAFPRSRPLLPELAEAAHMAAELVAARHGAPALHLPGSAWRWLDRHGDAIGQPAIALALRAVRRIASDRDARANGTDDDGSGPRAALRNLERRL